MSPVEKQRADPARSSRFERQSAVLADEAYAYEEDRLIDACARARTAL